MSSKQDMIQVLAQIPESIRGQTAKTQNIVLMADQDRTGQSPDPKPIRRSPAGALMVQLVGDSASGIDIPNPGNSGGVIYYTTATTLASSATLAQYGIVVGGGAGGAPATITPGSDFTVLCGNTGANPSFRQISLLTDINPATWLSSTLGGTGYQYDYTVDVAARGNLLIFDPAANRVLPLAGATGALCQWNAATSRWDALPASLPTTDYYLKFDGAQWVAAALPSTTYSAGRGIDITANVVSLLQTVTGLQIFSGGFGLSGSASSSITANTDNLSFDADAYANLRLTPDANWNLTGITAPVTGSTNGRRVTLKNTSASFAVTLKHATTSSGANQFYCPGATDYALRPLSSVDIAYDSTDAKWRVLDQAAIYSINSDTTAAQTIAYANTSSNTVVQPVVESPGSGSQQIKIPQVEAWKLPVRIASTANLGLSGLSAIDGVTPVAGDRVLAKDQSTTNQNGIYVAAAGAWSRAGDDSSASGNPRNQWRQGSLIVVNEGTTNAQTIWQMTAASFNPASSTTVSFTRVTGSSVGTPYKNLVANAGYQLNIYLGAGFTISGTSTTKWVDGVKFQSSANRAVTRQSMLGVSGATCEGAWRVAQSSSGITAASVVLLKEATYPLRGGTVTCRVKIRTSSGTLAGKLYLLYSTNTADAPGANYWSSLTTPTLTAGITQIAATTIAAVDTDWDTYEVTSGVGGVPTTANNLILAFKPDSNNTSTFDIGEWEIREGSSAMGWDVNCDDEVTTLNRLRRMEYIMGPPNKTANTGTWHSISVSPIGIGVAISTTQIVLPIPMPVPLLSTVVLSTQGTVGFEAYDGATTRYTTTGSSLYLSSNFSPSLAIPGFSAAFTAQTAHQISLSAGYSGSLAFSGHGNL